MLDVNATFVCLRRVSSLEGIRYTSFLYGQNNIIRNILILGLKKSFCRCNGLEKFCEGTIWNLDRFAIACEVLGLY